MSFISITRAYDQEKADETLGEGHNAQCQSGDVWTYEVLSDSMADTCYEAMYAFLGTEESIPETGDPHPSGYLRVKSKSAVRTKESPFCFLVTVNWGSTSESPVQFPTGAKWNVEISVDGVEYSQPAYKDVNGAALVNSAGDPFDPPLEQTYYDEEITVSFNTRTVDASAIESARGKTNSASFSFTVAGLSRTFATKTLKLVKASYSTVYENNDSYWKVSYVFRHRVDTWTRTVLDQGYNAWDSVASKLVIIKDKNGDPVNTPAMLDSDGAVTDTAHFLDFQMEGTASFSTLFTGL
jgi:hypothetical protein